MHNFVYIKTILYDKMIRIIALIIVFNLNSLQLISQPWHYGFGTGSGSYTSGTSTTFLPTPPSGNSITRVGSGSGSINLENQIITFGEDTYIRGVAPTAGSVNKFGVNDYSTGKCFTLKFTIRLGTSNGSSVGATSGNWLLFIGDGSTYADGNTFSGTQVFTGLRFAFGASGTITFNYRRSNVWVTTGISGTPFQQGMDYIVEIYGNNSLVSQTYTYGTLQSVDSNKLDIWVNGILIGNDLLKAQIANDANIDSWMFYGENSTGNVANIFVDNIDYHNDIAGTPLPVVLGSFELSSAGRAALLNWSTLSEVNNSGFVIERCKLNPANSENWEKAGFVSGAGTVNELRNYSFSDNNLQAGKYKYRLKQTDYNGNYEYFFPSNASEILISKPLDFELLQNYPNPSNPASVINYRIPEEGFVNLAIYDLSGKEVATLFNGFQKADYYTSHFNGSKLASGVYLYKLTYNGKAQNVSFTKKLVLIK